MEKGEGRGMSVLMARHDDDDTFLWGIKVKVNIIAQLEFELVYYNVTIQYVSHDATETRLTTTSLVQYEPEINGVGEMTSQTLEQQNMV